jgi:hypothetical protein
VHVLVFFISAAEYTGVHDTINSILSRCKQVQQRLGSSSSTSAINSTSSSHSPTYLSMRSQLLFEAPGFEQQVAAGSAAHVEVQQQPVVTGSKAATPQQQQPQQRPASPAWGGAVDLNPAGSFSFPPSESITESRRYQDSD